MRALALLCLLCCVAFARAQTRIDTLLAAMTLQQKAAQVVVATFYGYPPNAQMRDLLARWQVGAVVLLPSNLGTPQDVTRTTNALQQAVISAGGVPLFIGVDQEGGLIAHLKDGFTEFPVPALWTATGEPELAFAVGEAIGREMLAVGVNWNLSPVADLATNPRNGVIGRRSFGSDPRLVGQTVAEVVRGLQAVGVLATVKHFPGHGDTNEDSHVTLPILMHDIARLQTVELVPFAQAITAGAGAIMTAHIAYPNVDGATDRAASLSPVIIEGILREGMGYEGIVVTDAMDMDAIDTRYSPAESALLALEAGNDLLLLGAHLSPQTQMNVMQAIVDAVRAGRISEARLEASVRRILQMKERFGVLDWQALDEAGAPDRLSALDHSGLVRQLFEAGITLAYDDGILPLGAGTAFIYPATRASLWEACRPLAEGVQALAVSNSPTEEEVAWARGLAQRTEKVVVFTQNADANPRQRALVQALPPEKTLVVALQSVYDITTLPRVGAYMVTYSPMRAANTPLCEILFGQRRAQGRWVSLQIAR
jgi:beta-N-acetylhexosaminidase